MKGKLIKKEKDYYLYDFVNSSWAIGSSNERQRGTNSYKLSIKNCQAIELGYDLDELVKSKYPNVDNEDYEYDSEAEMLRDDYMSSGFLKGAKAILEILGDKKFSEEDVIKAMNQFSNTMKSVDKIFQSLQQTEWDVEILTDRIPADLAPGGWDVFPKLDAENCLILKRVK